MALVQQTILAQLDALLTEAEKVDSEKLPLVVTIELRTRITAALERLAPAESAYIGNLKSSTVRVINFESDALRRAIAVLKGLRADYAAGHLRSVTELIHADLFGDFLEMADHLIEQGYKDAAAVITGSVLEEHLRKLCDKHGVPILHSGKPKKADTLNAELATSSVHYKRDQKNVTAWLNLRNMAAHGKYSEYTKDQVALLIQSVRDFITRNPA